MQKLIVFTGKSCAWCKIVLRELHSIETEKQVNLQIEEVPIEENVELVEELGVVALPTVIFPDGTRVVGSVTPQQLREIVFRSMFYLFPQ